MSTILMPSPVNVPPTTKRRTANVPVSPPPARSPIPQTVECMHSAEPRSLSNSVSQCSSANDKALALFHEMDCARRGYISREQLGESLHVLGVQLDRKSVDAVFEDADADCDGKLSAKEFVETFVTHYNTLLSILFFRSRDCWEIQQLDSQCRQALQDAESKRSEIIHLKGDQTQIEARIAENESAMATLAEKQDEKDAAVKQVIAQFDTAKEVSVRAAVELEESSIDVAAGTNLCAYRAEEEEAWRSRLAQWESAVAELKDDVAGAEAEQQALFEKYQAAKAHTEEKKKLLTEAIQSNNECRENHSQCVMDLEDGVERTQQLLREHHRIEEQWRLCSAKLHESEDAMCNAEADAGEFRKIISAAALELSELHQLSSRTNQTVRSIQNEMQHMSEFAQLIRQKMSQMQDLRAHRDDQEQPLILQELQLREERRKLLLKEVSLRSSAASIYSTN